MKRVLFTVCCLVFLAGCSQPGADGNSNGNGVAATPSPEAAGITNETVSEDTPAANDAAEKPSPAQADDGKNPEFSDYKVDEVYTGETAKPVFNDKTSQFRTRLKEAAEGEVNFAGRYILAAWGCGTDCLMGGVIDAKTGETSMVPFSICCILEDADEALEKMDFRKDSRLIIFNGLLNEDDKGGKIHFYEFRNGEFTKLK